MSNYSDCKTNRRKSDKIHQLRKEYESHMTEIHDSFDRMDKIMVEWEENEANTHKSIANSKKELLLLENELLLLDRQTQLPLLSNIKIISIIASWIISVLLALHYLMYAKDV